MSAPRTPREVLFKMFRDFGSQHVDSPKILRAIEGLAGKIKSDADALIALHAWKVGVFEGAVQLATHWQRPLLAGIDASEGGKRGDVKAHGTADEREAEKSKARKLYAREYAKFPEALREHLAKNVEAEMHSVTWRTILRWVPNPKPTKRGRPRKRKH